MKITTTKPDDHPMFLPEHCGGIEPPFQTTYQRRVKPMFFDAPSTIQGHGCFTRVKVPKDVDIWCATYDSPEDSMHTIVNSENQSLELYAPFRFINHSENPNCDLYEDSQGEFFLVSLRVIDKNEEITIDYGDDWDATEGD
jgi:hypothetical protein